MKKYMQSFIKHDPFAHWFIGFFLLLASIFLAHYWVVGQAVYGDGIYHYAFTRSIVKDADIRLNNEYGHTYSPVNNNSIVPAPPVVVENVTANGSAQNKYGIGAPLFWVIPFAFVDFFVGVWNVVSLPISSHGFSDIYQIAVGLFNVMAATLGAVLLYLFLKNYFKPQAAFLSVTALLFGSSLFYYSSLDVVNSHPFSFLFSSIFLFFWWKTFAKRTLKQWFLLGLILGILLLIRTQDVVFLLLILAEIVVLLKQKGFNLSFIKKEIPKYVLFGAGIILAFLPQLFVWQTIYGDIWTSPYFKSGEGFTFLQPHLIDLFINPKIGIVFWTPLFLVCIAGLVAFFKKQKMLAGLSLLLVLSELYFISSWSGWTQGEAFGVRMLISSIPFMAIGLAYVMQLLLERFTLKKVIISVLVLVACNFALILYFLLMHQSPTNDGTVVTQDRSLEKIQKLFNLPL
jgi:hypothetical protein